jgi:ribosome-binding protein aMBF1 (putative translation factor)
MSLIDIHAAQRIQEMREARGLSPEALAADIATHALSAGWGRRGSVDAHTIRRIERHGHVPGPRVAFVMASYFGMPPHELWEARNRRAAPSSRRVAA